MPISSRFSTVGIRRICVIMRIIIEIFHRPCFPLRQRADGLDSRVPGIVLRKTLLDGENHRRRPPIIGALLVIKCNKCGFVLFFSFFFSYAMQKKKKKIHRWFTVLSQRGSVYVCTESSPLLAAPSVPGFNPHPWPVWGLAHFPLSKPTHDTIASY